MNRVVRQVVASTLSLFAGLAHAEGDPLFGGGRLLATGGATQVEGAAGGGLVPWAVIAGYGTEDQIGGAAFYTHVGVQDFTLQSFGAGLGLFDRVELSFAQHRFDVDALDTLIRQNVFGAKIRLYGDLVYTRIPQLAAGMQFKDNLDFAIPALVGAFDSRGADYYVTATKLFLETPVGRSLLVNATLRFSKANQLGLLGFGGDDGNAYQPLFEGSAALLLTRWLALGYEWRQKPDNLSFSPEDAWQDVFIALFVNKHVSLVGAWASLGTIAGFRNQQGYYLSLQIAF